jgi:hypothetical protein
VQFAGTAYLFLAIVTNVRAGIEEKMLEDDGASCRD